MYQIYYSYVYPSVLPSKLGTNGNKLLLPMIKEGFCYGKTQKRFATKSIKIDGHQISLKILIKVTF